MCGMLDRRKHVAPPWGLGLPNVHIPVLWSGTMGGSLGGGARWGPHGSLVEPEHVGHSEQEQLPLGVCQAGRRRLGPAARHSSPTTRPVPVLVGVVVGGLPRPLPWRSALTPRVQTR